MTIEQGRHGSRTPSFGSSQESQTSSDGVNWCIEICIRCKVSFFHKEPQKGLRNQHAIMRLPHPRHGFRVYFFAEDPLLAPLLQQLRHNLLCEFRVALHRHHPLRDVHALNLAWARRSEFLDALRVVVYEIFVHLEHALPTISLSDSPLYPLPPRCLVN